MLDGVCGGIAEYFAVDPVLVRVVFVLFTAFHGSGLIAYIVGMIIMPRAPLETEAETLPDAEKAPSSPVLIQSTPDTPEKPVPAYASAGSLIIGLVLVILGGLFLLDNLDFPFFHNFFWWFRHNFWDFFIPGIIIVIGLVLIFKGAEKQNRQG